MFIVDVKANKQQITQAGRKLYDIDGAKIINILIRPNGEKKSYVRRLLTVVLWMLPAKMGASKLGPAG